MSDTNVVHLTIPMPYFTDDLTEVYREYIEPQLPLVEIVSIVLFIEYFSDEQDRSQLRSEYLTNVIGRFGRYNVGTRGTDEQFVHLLMSHGVPLPFNTEQFLRGSKTHDARNALNRLRVKYQRHYLKLSENIDLIYNAIASFYRNSPRQNQVFDSLSREFTGFLPRVTINRDHSLGLTVVRHSVI